MKKLTASKLRENIYRILDDVLKTGKETQIERKGRIIKIVPEKIYNKLKTLKRRSYLKCDPEEIIHLDWSEEWKPDDLS